MTQDNQSTKAAIPSRAMLLAAGQGTRLRPHTATVAKCMMPVKGKPILEHNVERLREYGVTDVVINLHYLPESVRDYFGDGRRWGVRICYSFEPDLLGTAGAVRRMADFFDGPFFVWYGDNLSNCRLDRLWEQHRRRNGAATIALHRREDPTNSGIVGLDANDRIVCFLEKPQADQVFSYWVSAGIFVLERTTLQEIPTEGPSDFGRDVFPDLLTRGVELYGYRMSPGEELWWIDTPEDLLRVQALMNDSRLQSADRN